MRASRANAIIAVMAVVIAVLFWALVYFARHELRLVARSQEDEIPTRSAVGNAGGFPSVSVSTESQAAAGIVTRELAAARSDAAAEVYGVVVNIQPLLEVRARYLSAIAEGRALRAAAASSGSEYQRMQRLYQDDRNVSERAVLAAEAQMKGDQARLAAAEQQAASMLDGLRSAWGETIAGWAANAHSTIVDALSSQREALLQVTFSHDLQTDAARGVLTIAPVSARGAGRAARLVSASPQTDTSLPGVTYFYLAGGSGLRVGMRVAGQLKLGGKPRAGVVVPAAAVVWYGGKAWAYVKERDDVFLRRQVSASQEMGDGYFVAAGFEPGDQVVVSGAQLLLSEELKFQIRNENQD